MKSSRTAKGAYDFTDPNLGTPDLKTKEDAELVWFGSAVLLKDFPDKNETPTIVKIVHGEYMNLGPKQGAPNETQENEVLIYSVETTTKVLAVNMRVKDGKGVSQTDNKLSIPLTYEGWFEVLSEDGRRVKPIESIKDLARIFPHTCLVRRAIEGLVPLENGTLKPDHKRVANVGETLILFGVTSLAIQGQSSVEPVKFLRCLDEGGDSIYFKHDLTGLFSPVAGRENISGVHTIKGILNKFHLPVTCKLVHGSYPKNVDKTKFSGIVRIVYVYDEATAFVCPASGQYRMIPIPVEVPLKVVPALNFGAVRQTELISRVLEKCSDMVKCYQNSIHLLYDVEVLPTPKDGTNPLLDNVDGGPKEKDPENDKLYDEVEDIYFYVVRHGVQPPALPRRMYKDGEQDNDFWEQPIYKTLHKQKQRQSIVDAMKQENGSAPGKNGKNTKMYRFYHEGENGSRPLAYLKTSNDEVDEAIDINQTQIAPKLVAMNRRKSEGALQANGLDTKGAKGRRKSTPTAPAIIRYLFKRDYKNEKGAGVGGSGSSDGSYGEKKRPESKAKEKLKNLYL